MKILKIALVIIVVLVAAVIITVPFVLKDAIKKATPVAGQKVMGVPVSLADASISLLKGNIRLTGLNIGNPAGFKTDHAFKVKTIDVEWVPRSVFTKMIVIRNITIDSPDIIFEQAISGNNFGKIMDNLKGAPPVEKKEKKETKEPEKAGTKSKTKVVIDIFLIKNGMINLSMPGMGSAAAPIPLPEVRLTDIGKDKQGATLAEVINQVFAAIFDSLKKAVISSGNIVGKGLESAGATAGEGAQIVGETAKDAGKAAGGAATKAVGEIKGILGGK